jgi:hypothetical protein
VQELERLRGRGGQFLIVPPTGFWWLEHYAEFAEYLRSRCRIVLEDPEVGAIFAFGAGAEAAA